MQMKKRPIGAFFLGKLIEPVRSLKTPGFQDELAPARLFFQDRYTAKSMRVRKNELNE